MVARTGYRTAQPKSHAELFEGMKQDYAAAKSSRFRRRRTGLAYNGSGADYHYRSDSDYLRIMEQARDMDRNDAIVGQIVDRAISNIVQQGFTLDPQTGDDGLDVELYERFDEWSKDPEQCDAAGELSFYDMEQLVPRSVIVDGDMCVLPLQDGSLELVEAHRLRTPSNTKQNVVHGVMLNEQRRRIQYWFTKDDIAPGEMLKLVGDVKQYRARDDFGHRQVFHAYNPKRVTQTRGISTFAPIFDPLGMAEDIQFAAMVKQQISSCFTIFRTKGLDDNGGALPNYGEPTVESTPSGTRQMDGITPGMEITGEWGEKLQGFSPNIPSESFFQHMKLILQFIGLNLGMPLVLVLLDASETNFSGWRGAVDQARLGFRRNQKWLISRFHTPVYKWKVRQWMAMDAAIRNAGKRSGVKIFNHEWKPPSWPYIQPLQDASTDLLRMRNGLASPRRIHSEGGREFQTEAIHTIEDNAFRIRAAKREAAAINKEFETDNSPVDWRQLISLPTPDGVSMNFASNVPTGDESNV